MPLFEIAAIELPKKKEDVERLILPPTAVLAPTPEGVIVQATIEHAEKFKGADKNRLQLIIRPFAVGKA